MEDGAEDGTLYYAPRQGQRKPFLKPEFFIWYVQSGAEISGRTRVYHNQAGPGKPSPLASRDMPGVVGCAASQPCQAAQHPLQAD